MLKPKNTIKYILTTNTFKRENFNMKNSEIAFYSFKQNLSIYKWSSVIHVTQSAQIPQKQDERHIYVIMKAMCLPGYHHNAFVATHALGHMMYGSCAQVHELPQSHCGDNQEGTLFS